MAAKAAKPKVRWRCPKCGREFPRKTGFHSCGQYTVEGYLEGKNPDGVALFNLLSKTAQSLGPVTVLAVKTQISFRVHSTFLMVTVAGRQLVGYLFLPRAAPAPFFRKVVAHSSRRVVHCFRLADAATVTGDFATLLAEAISFASESDETPKTTDSKQPRIGEEINALYRADRLAVAGKAEHAYV